MKDLRKLYCILMTMPVTSAEAERTFSKLALIKSKLHTTCGQDRLEKLVVCNVECDVLQEADLEAIVDRFSTLGGGEGSRRVLLH